MKISEYLKKLDPLVSENKSQLAWYEKLEKRVKEGIEIFEMADYPTRAALLEEFRSRVQTEAIKAWYSSPEGYSLFQGTSISSLTIPCEFSSPLRFQSIYDLEEAIADGYIRLHDEHESVVNKAIIEDIDDWLKAGLYYGVVISSKVISQAFGLTVPHEEGNLISFLKTELHKMLAEDDAILF